jgi:hypothetical protein
MKELWAFEEIGLPLVLNGTMYKLAARFTDSRNVREKRMNASRLVAKPE